MLIFCPSSRCLPFTYLPSIVSFRVGWLPYTYLPSIVSFRVGWLPYTYLLGSPPRVSVSSRLFYSTLKFSRPIHRNVFRSGTHEISCIKMKQLHDSWPCFPLPPTNNLPHNLPPSSPIFSRWIRRRLVTEPCDWLLKITYHSPINWDFIIYEQF